MTSDDDEVPGSSNANQHKPDLASCAMHARLLSPILAFVPSGFVIVGVRVGMGRSCQRQQWPMRGGFWDKWRMKRALGLVAGKNDSE